MIRTIGIRVLTAVPTVLGVTVVLFLVLQLVPGDPIAALVSSSGGSPELIASLEKSYGLDEPLVERYLSFLGGAVQGDLGTSYATRQPVSTMIAQQLGPTIELALAAVVFTAVVGIVLGTVAATYRGTGLDGLIRVVSLLGTSIPSFWIGLMLVMVVSFRFGWLPATGSDGIQRLILPTIALGISSACVVARVVRNNVLEILGENFVPALHAKGLSRRRIMVVHVLRNALAPAVTIVGLQLGALLAGGVVIEMVFARQGLGNLLQRSILLQDYPVIQGVVLLMAVAYIAINLLVDIAYIYIDPRMRAAAATGR